jgi:tetratricopeptide (TPR) repeat protein
MRGRGILRATPAVVLALVVGAGCVPAPRAPRTPVADDLRPYLPPPGQALGADVRPALADLHARLLSGEPASGLRADLDQFAASEPEAVQVLRAELDLVEGDGAAAFQELEQLPAPVRGRTMVLLLEARAREMAGDTVEAYALFHELASALPEAARRAGGLESKAVVMLRARIGESLARGRTAEAQRSLERLRSWRPRDVETWNAAAAVAAALGDRTSELAALRALATSGTLDDRRIERRAHLELEVGEPDVALDLLERLSARHPGDAEIADDLDRARFDWRLAHAPEAVQSAARSAVLTRAQLARLLYWLVPGVRAGRGGVPRIASDVVGHEAQEEIVRVVNLGLMSVDETLHLFEPDQPARRVEALSSVLRAAALDGGMPECTRVAPATGWTREGICAAAHACALVASEADCLPGGQLSGAEAVGWVRRALAAGEAPR